MIYGDSDTIMDGNVSCNITIVNVNMHLAQLYNRAIDQILVKYVQCIFSADNLISMFNLVLFQKVN